MLVCLVEGVPYVDKEGGEGELSFTSFEVVKAIVGPCASADKGANHTFYQLCHPEQHLGELWSSSGNLDRAGLGYHLGSQKLPAEGEEVVQSSSQHQPGGETSTACRGYSKILPTSSTIKDFFLPCDRLTILSSL